MDFNKSTITSMDSLPDPREWNSKAYSFIYEYLEEKMIRPGASSSWTTRHLSPAQQNNGVDCGVFVVAFALQALLGDVLFHPADGSWAVSPVETVRILPSDLSETDIKDLRMCILHAVIHDDACCLVEWWKRVGVEVEAEASV